MATSLLLTSIASLLRRSTFPAAVRYSSVPSKPEDMHKGKVPTESCEMPDDLGLSVGIEREEHLARAAGNDDPFEMKPVKIGKSTFEDPIVITSPNKKRMVGCTCEADSVTVSWMWLHKGEPKRCECGYWFKLVEPEGSCHT